MALQPRKRKVVPRRRSTGSGAVPLANVSFDSRDARKRKRKKTQVNSQQSTAAPATAAGAGARKWLVSDDAKQLLNEQLAVVEQKKRSESDPEPER